MGLLVLLGDDPGLDAVVDHVINHHPVSEMNGLLNAQNTKNFKLDGGQVVQQVVKFHILTGLLNALVNRDDQLVGLFDGQLSFGVDNGLDSGLDEFLLEEVQVLEVTLLVYKIVFK